MEQLNVKPNVNELATQLLDTIAAHVLLRLQSALTNGSVSNGIEHHDQGTSKRGRKALSKRAASRQIGLKVVLDYFTNHGPASAQKMADALGITHTTAYKRVKGLKKELKRVKEGTNVMYMVKPRRGSKKAKAAA